MGDDKAEFESRMVIEAARETNAGTITTVVFFLLL